jgi:hypothetical protein
VTVAASSVSTTSKTFARVAQAPPNRTCTLPDPGMLSMSNMQVAAAIASREMVGEVRATGTAVGGAAGLSRDGVSGVLRNLIASRLSAREVKLGGRGFPVSGSGSAILSTTSAERMPKNAAAAMVSRGESPISPPCRRSLTGASRSLYSLDSGKGARCTSGWARRLDGVLKTKKPSS